MLMKIDGGDGERFYTRKGQAAWLMDKYLPCITKTLEGMIVSALSATG